MESLFIGLLQFFFMQRERTAHKNINFYKEGEQLENYTKYRLKSSEELASVLEGKDNLFVIACNKCFKEFETVDEPDCDEFLNSLPSRERPLQAVQKLISYAIRCIQKENYRI